MSINQRPKPLRGIRTIEIMHSTKPAALNSPAVPAQVHSGLQKPFEDQNYKITVSAPGSIPPVPVRFSVFKRLIYFKIFAIPKRPRNVDKVKWAYLRCAMLFAASVLITWIPASANRVYGLLYPNAPNFPLNVCSALVLPLQGFWNTLIYFTTSLAICKSCWAKFKGKKDGDGIRMLEIGPMTTRGGLCFSPCKVKPSPGGTFCDQCVRSIVDDTL